MFAISPQLTKILLAFLLLLPALSLYIKILSPHLAQNGFDGALVILIEIVFVIFIGLLGRFPSNISRNGVFLIAALLCWHISGFISAVLSDHFHASIIKQIEYAVHCLFAYSAWIFLSQTQKQEKMAYFLIFTLMWVVYYILAAWHSNPEAYYHDWVNGTPMFNNIRHLGFLQIAIMSLLFIPLLTNKPYKNLTTLVLLTIFWASVIWSCSRGTFISAIIISSLLALLFTQSRKSILILSITAFLLGWFIALIFPSESGSLNPLRLLFLNFENIENLNENQLSSGRIEIWRLTLINMWQENIAFGFGPDGYKYVTPHIWPNTTQPHSGPVQLFSEYGVIGFSVLLCVLAATIQLWINRPSTTINKLARIALLAVAIGSLVDGHFYHTFSLLLISLLVALSFNKAKTTSGSTKQSLCFSFTTLAIVSIFIWPISQHWSTYLEQEFPIMDDSQLEQVASFPSYYRPMYWLYHSASNPELRTKAIKLGQKHGPNKCNYFIVEYLDLQNIEKQKLLIKSIKQVCSKVELNRSQNSELAKVALELTR